MKTEESFEISNPRLIVVLGMHRSGTSAITRGLQVMGVELGSHLMPAIEDVNNKGFWEDLDINALNIKLLNEIGSDWHHVTPIQESDVKMLHTKGYFLEAVELLRSKLHGAQIFAFKDPRVSKLLPFWKEVFSHCRLQTSYVLALRNPLSVVKSLAKRDQLDGEKSYLLWIDHVLTSLIETEHEQRIAVDFDYLMRAPDQELRRIAKQLDLKIQEEALQVYTHEFLDASLRNTTYRLEDLLLDNACPPLAYDMCQALQNVASDTQDIDSPFIQAKIVDWSNELRRMTPSLALIDRLAAGKASALQAASEQAKHIISLDQLIQDKNEETSSLIRTVEKQNQHVDHLLQAQQAHTRSLNNEILKRDEAIAILHGEIVLMRGSRSWRITAPIRHLTDKMRQALGADSSPRQFVRGIKALRHKIQTQGGIKRACQKTIQIVKDEGWTGIKRRALSTTNASAQYDMQIPGAMTSENYAKWVEHFDTLTSFDLDWIRAHISATGLPKILVVAQLTEATEVQAQQTISSLRKQIYEEWEAILIVSPSLAKIRHEDRIKIVHDKNRSFDELEHWEGPVLCLDGPIVLREHATYMFALGHNDGSEIVYADSDLLNSEATTARPAFKPSYSKELALHSDYLGNCVSIVPNTREAQVSIKFFIEGAISLPEALRANAAALPSGKVTHLPFVLFHDRHEISLNEITPQAPISGQIVPTVCIIIPTRNRIDFLQPCISSILEKSDYPSERIQIIVMDNGSTEPDILEYMQRLADEKTITLLHDPQKFNYARLNNQAASTTEAEILVFLNNDVVIDDPQWLRRLVAHAVVEDVGAVGGKLLYPDRTVQHGGIILGIQGVAAHAHHNLSEHAPGYFGLNNISREVSAVTGACLAMRKCVFDNIGGFDEALAVAFNDVKLCLDAKDLGYRNIYLHEPLLIHYESKTRGFDDTPEKIAIFRGEAGYARSKHKSLMGNDPCYNPNLSFERPYDLAVPPRAVKPWHKFRREQSRKIRILMLSSTHEIGHGVAVVLDIQCRYLVARGHEIFVGGPRGKNEFKYEGCERIYVENPNEAAIFAAERNIDCIVAHTPPFFSTFRWTGSQQKTMVYDYGEPPSDFFPDAHLRRAVEAEKKFCLSMASKLYAISNSVCIEAAEPSMKVIRIANSHLAVWNQDVHEDRRIGIRKELGLEDKIVILNVCRFHRAERHYKGIDTYVAARECFISSFPDLADKIVFVLCGKGNSHDVAEMKASGLMVFANVTDERLIDLYCAADIYANFSMWEGYNLGIGQALSMGLPVVASDIPAHREFGVFTSNDSAMVCEEFKRIITLLMTSSNPLRQPKVWRWEEPLEKFAEAIEELVYEEV